MDAIKILGSLLGGGGVSRGASGDLIGGLLRQAMGGAGAPAGSSSGGIGDLLGAVTGGAGAGVGAPGAALSAGGSASGGGLGGILGGIAMAALARYTSGGMGPAGAGASALGNLFGGAGGSALAPSSADDPQANAGAEVLVRAMLQAAKADGRVDDDEERAILERMGDLDADEREFVQRVLHEPVDAGALARSVPRGMEREVYAMSLVAMDVDQRSEARFLHELAQGLGMSAQQCNAIHREMGEPEIFR